MRAADLLKHITVKNHVLAPGRILQHLRFMPVYMEPTAQPDFHASAMYREAYANTPEGHAAFEQAAQVMQFIQGEIPPPGGVTADSKPGDESDSELPDGSSVVTFSRS